jgi:hypothetical protein
MRGRGAWVLGGLMFGCVETPHPSLPAARAAAPVAEAPPSCTLPSEIEIAVRDNAVFVNGAHVEKLSMNAARPTALTRLLGPCVARPTLVTFALDAQAPAALTRALLREVPLSDLERDSLRFGSSPASPVKLAEPSWVAGHWVRLNIHWDSIEAFELERSESEPGAPTVMHQARLANLTAADAFIQAACATKECIGVILFLAPDSKNSVIESALSAARSSRVPEPLLALRDSSALEGKHDSDFGLLKVSGRLAPELIQSAVRKSYGGLRKCYEAGLARNSSLAGRVAVRFVIELDGTVTNVSNGGSELADPEVVQCVIAHFYTLKFPPPEGGIVTVVYPIMLSPG